MNKLGIKKGLLASRLKRKERRKIFNIYSLKRKIIILIEMRKISFNDKKQYIFIYMKMRKISFNDKKQYTFIYMKMRKISFNDKKQYTFICMYFYILY